MRTILASVLAMLLCVSSGLAQNRDAQANADMNASEAELLKTAASTCDRIEFPHPRGRAVLPFMAAHGSQTTSLPTARTSPHRTTSSATRS